VPFYKREREGDEREREEREMRATARGGEKEGVRERVRVVRYYDVVRTIILNWIESDNFSMYSRFIIPTQSCKKVSGVVLV